MILIGEKLNSSVPSAFKAYQAGDEAYIRRMARKQAENGAQYLDLNASMLKGEEKQKLVWAAKLAMEECDAGLCLDSPDPAALEYALPYAAGRPVILNSVTLEEKRLAGVLPLLRDGAGVVAMPVDQKGIPKTAQARIENARRLIGTLTDAGVAPGNIYLDIVLEAVSADWESPRQSLLAVAALRQEYPDVHLLAGVSNVSFGLPKRVCINGAFLSSAVAMGLDTAIMDVTIPALRLELLAALMVNGQDEYCADYIAAYREMADS